MVVLKLGGSAVDYEIGLLTKILALLDVELSRVNAEICKSPDPESDGLCDIGEFLIGSGLVAVQRYLNATRADLGFSQEAYDKPPMFNQNIAMVRAINTISNYWKHCAEWDEAERKGLDPCQMRGSASTIRYLERMGDLSDYPCANALAIMLQGKDLALSNLLTPLSLWRRALLVERS